MKLFYAIAILAQIPLAILDEDKNRMAYIFYLLEDISGDMLTTKQTLFPYTILTFWKKQIRLWMPSPLSSR